MTVSRHGLSLTVAACIALFTSGCRTVPEQAAQAPTAPPPIEAAPPPATTPVPLDAPSLDLVQGEANVESAGRTLSETPETLGVGDAIAIGERGLAVLRWEPGLRAELLAGGHARLEAGAEDRTARLVQTGGIARYSVAAAADGAAIDVTAGAVTLRADEAADVIVGFDPDVADATWVYVIGGTVALEGATAVAVAAGSDAGDVTAPTASAARLDAGHAVVFTRSGEQPVALPIDLGAIEAWYAAALAGSAPTIARASFRCAVRADAQAVVLRAMPPTAGAIAGGDEAASDRAGVPPIAASAGEPLAPRTLVEVAARDATGEWLQVTVIPEGGFRPPSGGADAGWLSIDDLDCVGPVAGLAVLDDEAMAAAPPYAEAPSAPPTPGPASFAADRTSLVMGDCALLTWDVPVGTAVTLNGRAVAGKGVERACPDAGASYRLTWVDAAGKRQERVIQVAVEQPSAQAIAASAAGGGDTARGGGQAAPAEPTPCETECIQILPTLEPEPTRRPRPTPTTRPEPSSPPPAPTVDPRPRPTAQPPDPTRPPSTSEPGPGAPTQTPSPSATPEPTDPGAPPSPTEPSPVPTLDPSGTPSPGPTTPTPSPGTPTPPDPGPSATPIPTPTP